jgi:hypothetical protein
MKRRCKKLREKAVRDGLQSRAGAAWRIHGRSCRDCRTELFVLETLQGQASKERRHLPRKEVAQLIDAARRTHLSRRRRWEPVWSWSWRLAALSTLVLVLVNLQFDVPVEGTAEGDSAEAMMLAQVPDDASGNYGVPVVPLSAIHQHTVDTIVKPGGAVDLPAILPGRSVDRYIHNIRRRIDVRRNTLLDLIERDLGEGMRQDVWDPPMPAVSLAA